MIRVQIVRQSLEETSAEWFETDDMIALFRQVFGNNAPENCRLYHQHISELTDVTPTTAEQEAALKDLPGPFYLVVAPGEFITLTAVLTALAYAVAGIILQSILAQDLPSSASRQIRDESPNNGLSDRTNQARVNGRIPRILGEVRSTPDLIAGTYKIFEAHREKEVAYMCVGVGAYDISDVRDDTTLVSEIAGTSVEVFGPNTSPNSGHEPQLRIGSPINTPVFTTKRQNSVNGQTLQPQDVGRVQRRLARFVSPNVIESLDPIVDYTEYFVAGDVIAVTEAAQTTGVFTYSPPAGADFNSELAIGPSWGEITFAGNHVADWSAGQIMTLSNATVSWDDGSGFPYNTSVAGVYEVLSSSYDGVAMTTTVRIDISENNSAWTSPTNTGGIPGTGFPTMSRPSGIVQFDLSGTYTINTVTGTTITLDNPSAVNPDWTVMQDDYGGVSRALNPIIVTTGERWVGWFTVQMLEPMDRFISNAVAINGMYALDDSGTQHRVDVAYSIQAQRLDSAGNPTGDVYTYDRTVQGSGTTRTGRADTAQITLPGPASAAWRFRARRTSPTNPDDFIQVVDTIQWRDLYAGAAVAQTHFGNVTTVHTVTFATDGALALKERKLNMLAVSVLPILQADGTFGAPAPTREFKDGLCAVALDPKVGNRTLAELDLINIYQTWADVREYFGFDAAAQFSYTLDKSDMSFEETVTAIAQAVFCQAYRRGSQLRMFFERETDESTILFNHRNSLPGTQKRTTNFSSPKDNDGIELQYVSPDDDSVVTIRLPNDSIVNPETIETVGIRNAQQAHLHAYRAWNKLQYQHTTVEVDVLQEADMLVLGERVIVSDTTRSGEQAGYVRSVDGLLLSLSQPMEWGDGSYVIFVQNSDAVTESIPITPGPDSTSVILSRAPRTPIVVNGVAPTRYIIGASNTARQVAPFLVTAKDPGQDGAIVSLNCVNYDARYYQNDGDYRP